METYLPNKFLHAHQKSHVTLRYETAKPDYPEQISFQHLKCYGHSKMLEQSLSSKYFCIIASLSYMTAFQTAGIHLRKQWLHLFCFIYSLWGASNLLYIKIIIFSGFSYFS